jgi:hypothetical protein
MTLQMPGDTFIAAIARTDFDVTSAPVEDPRAQEIFHIPKRALSA